MPSLVDWDSAKRKATVTENWTYMIFVFIQPLKAIS